MNLSSGTARRVATLGFDTTAPAAPDSAATPPPIAAARDSEAARSRIADRWTCATLWLRIQADAFRLDPLGYLQAVGWRIRGLRVRSRNRIAGLAGRSPSAYRFWISCREPKLRASAGRSRCDNPALFLPVIDCRVASDGLEDTVASLPPHIDPIVIGADFPGTVRIDRVSELARHCGPEAWLCPLSPGDRLAADAAFVYVGAIASEPTTSVFYADDDILDVRGERTRPHFKPDWNPELFQHHDFVTGACVVRMSETEIGRVTEADWPQALLRRALEREACPRHVARILHHRRVRPEPVIPPRPAHVSTAGLPAVSVIVPTRNGVQWLRKCVAGLGRTEYPHIQLIVVDNDSDELDSMAFLDALREGGATVVRIDGAFNYSALNNAAVAHATGSILCFLNNDIEMLDGDWLALLARHAVRPDIGAVGARLLYPDRTIQHAGVFTGIGGGAAHAHRFQNENERGYFERARLPQRVSAVTGACLAVLREKFLAVGGFDEENFPVAFNDVDLCLKLNAHGWQSFYEPRATLIHHESKSRGNDRAKENRARFADELAALKRIWRTDQRPDPFHHPNLSPFCEQFVIAV